jgi:hypothetical protein
MKGTEYFVALLTSFILTKGCNVVASSEELIRTTEYLMLHTTSLQPGSPVDLASVTASTYFQSPKTCCNFTLKFQQKVTEI